ncbi:hypothetical protein CC80DRAFT_599503 [Byssothecium circinans]|uniref:Uncharacterized protein n=1 Tax=Byssothecium circinans TaxID=147558 RepID=A0A6A5TIC7_9PLEO|nr:hypothetical protein CC80DRAFT_599503 [Byssothecium circinans]
MRRPKCKLDETKSNLRNTTTNSPQRPSSTQPPPSPRPFPSTPQRQKNPPNPSNIPLPLPLRDTIPTYTTPDSPLRPLSPAPETPPWLFLPSLPNTTLFPGKWTSNPSLYSSEPTTNVENPQSPIIPVFRTNSPTNWLRKKPHPATGPHEPEPEPEPAPAPRPQPTKSPKWYKSPKLKRPNILYRHSVSSEELDARLLGSASELSLSRSLDAIPESSCVEEHEHPDEQSAHVPPTPSAHPQNLRTMDEQHKAPSPSHHPPKWTMPRNKIYRETTPWSCKDLPDTRIEALIASGALVVDAKGIRHAASSSSSSYILWDLGRGKRAESPTSVNVKAERMREHFEATVRRVNIVGEEEWGCEDGRGRGGGRFVDRECEVREGVVFGEGSRRREVRFEAGVEVWWGEEGGVEAVGDNEGKSRRWAERRREERERKRARREARRKAREDAEVEDAGFCCISEEGIFEGAKDGAR